MAGQSPPNRGRVQAQGPKTEESVAWPPPTDPPTKAEVLEMLDLLWAKLSSRQQDDRRQCFADARKWVQERPAKGVDAVSRPSFPNRKMRGGVRVDIEVLFGKACVDDPPSPDEPDEPDEPDDTSEDGQT